MYVSALISWQLYILIIGDFISCPLRRSPSKQVGSFVAHKYAVIEQLQTMRCKRGEAKMRCDARHRYNLPDFLEYFPMMEV